MPTKYKKAYHSEFGIINPDIYELNDLMVDDNAMFLKNRNHTFRNFLHLYDGVLKRFKKSRYHSPWRRESNAEIIDKTMRNIMNRFFDKLINDIIYEDVEFCFPSDFMRLSIGYNTRFPRYDVRLGSIRPKFHLLIDKTEYKKMHKIRYMFRVSTKYFKKLRKEVISNNHEYVNTVIYDSSK